MIWPDTLPAVIRGTAVAMGARGVLLTGASGSGKSSLALQMMALGAGFVSDDLTELARSSSGQIAMRRPLTAPQPAGIEARGLGLLSAREIPGLVDLTLIVQLDHTETKRLPHPEMIHIAGCAVRSVLSVDNPAFPAMLVQYLREGFLQDPT